MKNEIVPVDNDASVDYEVAIQEPADFNAMEYLPEANIEESNAEEVIIETVADAANFVIDGAEFYFGKQDLCGYIKLDGKNRIIPIASRDFRDRIRLQYYDGTGKFAGKESIESCISTVDAVAYHLGKKIDVAKRIYQTPEKTVYIDINNKKGDVVKITDETVSIVKDVPDIQGCIFKRSETMGTQVLYEEDTDFDWVAFMKSIVPNISYNDFIIIVVYLVVINFMNIERPILMLLGNKGSGKSTLAGFIQSLVDVVVGKNEDALVHLDKKKKDAMETSLNSRYFIIFDNVTHLTNDQSDMLCMCCTSGKVEKRKLYTDGDMYKIQLDNAIVLTGVASVTGQADLLDRCIKIQLLPLGKSINFSAVLKQKFDENKAKVLFGIYCTMSGVLSIIDDIDYGKPTRLAMFEKYGYATSLILFGDGEKFLNAYRENRNEITDDILVDDPVGYAILNYVYGLESKGFKFPFKMSSSKFQEAICITALKLGTNTLAHPWPQNTSAFGHKLERIKLDLSNAGVDIESKKNSVIDRYKLISLNENFKSCKPKVEVDLPKFNPKTKGYENET